MKIGFKLYRLIGKRLFGLGRDDETWGEVTHYGTDGRSFKRLDAYKGFVYSCINLIAEQYASYVPVITRGDDDNKKVVQKHPFIELLKRPGGRDDKAVNISMFDLLHATSCFIDLQGDVYWYLAKGVMSGKPREIVILRTDRVGKEINKETGDIERYYVRTAGGAKVYIEIDEMIYFPGFDPQNPYRAVGTTEAASDYIQTEEFSTKFVRNFFLNNAGISGVLSLIGTVTPPAFKKFVRQWREKYEGVDSAGKTAIMRATEAKFTKVGLGLDELDMSALRKMSFDDIAIMFRVPMPLLGKAEESGLGRANVEALEYIFSKYTVEPRLKRLDAILQFALERYYGADGLTIGHKNIIPADKEHLLNERDKGVDRWLTRNEIREAEGHDKVDGGDSLRAPLSSQPIDEKLAPAESSGKGGGLRLRVKTVVKDEEINPDNKEVFRLSLMRNQGTYERRYKTKLAPVLREQESEVLKNLEAKAGSFKKDFSEKLFDDQNADQQFKSVLEPVLLSLAEDQGVLALIFAGDEDTEFNITAALRAALEASTQKMAENFNDETLAKLNGSLTEGIAAGESLSKLKKRVEQIYLKARGYRAERVARTETLKASNSATNSAYKQTGYVKAKKWYANPGADNLCLAMEGKDAIPLDATFLEQGESVSYTDEEGNEQTHVNSYDIVSVPPIHPNCRCTIVPVR